LRRALEMSTVSGAGGRPAPRRNGHAAPVPAHATSPERTTVAAALAEPTLCGAFQVTAHAGGERPALLTYGSDEAVTWDEYAGRVRTVATGLSALGVRAGQTVALLLRNRPAFNVVDTAVLHVGAVPFSIYHTEPVEQMLALVLDSGAEVLVTEPRFLDHALAVADGSDQLRHVVVDGDPGERHDRVMTLSDVERLDNPAFDFDAAWRAVTPDSIATLVYTSGTTGAPKAVQIPHRAVMHSLSGSVALAPCRAIHRGVSFLPAAHITDRFICHYTTIGLGGTLTSVPDPNDLWDAIVDVRPTRFFGVPRTFEKLLDRARAVIDADPALQAALETGTARVRAEQSGAGLGPEEAARASEANERLRPVREHLGLDRAEWLAVAAAPTSYPVLEFQHAIGLNLAELWGMSEFMMAIMNPVDRVKLGTVGVPLPSVEARLAASDSGDEAAGRGRGELLLRGPHACAGYRNDPEKTAAMLDADGWAHSGDLASVDEDGYYRIVGRKKEQMINSSGKNLFPAKIEAAIAESSPLIGYIASIGDRRRFVTALVVLDAEPLRAFAAEHGLEGPHAQLAAAPEVQAEVARAVAEGNQRLSRVEQVRAWKVLDVEWQPGGEEVTNTMKLRRSAIDEKYAAEIEALYG
jgi:long-chain acyl-CoA synthetase